MNRKILFVSGTRADFGKLKSLITKVDQHADFDAFLFVTGMHMLSKYGMTSNEIDKCKFQSVYKYINQNANDGMDTILAKTILGLKDYVKEIRPDMIVVHGDRVEAMAGAIVASLNNILAAHIEGGEVSGTIDELIRHSITKMAHLHYVANEAAKNRLLQLGERAETVHIIGSPDLDAMNSPLLPTLENVTDHYAIDYDEYAIFIYHPVTTELDNLESNISSIVDALIDSKTNYVVIYPNNDDGTDVILNELDRLRGLPEFKVFPSIRFENFLTLLRNAKYIIGNSSAGVREAPHYGLPSVNIGSRQNNRAKAESIVNCDDATDDVIAAIKQVQTTQCQATQEFGCGGSDNLFVQSLESEGLWRTSMQKVFVDL